MPTVRVKENEPFEVAMRRFKRTVEKTGLLTELRAREFYEKPTSERKRKRAAAVKRHFKRLRSQQLPPRHVLSPFPHRNFRTETLAAGISLPRCISDQRNSTSIHDAEGTHHRRHEGGMRAKDTARLSAVRLLLAAIKQREVDERIELTDADVVAVIDKMLKQRRDSIAQYEAGGRQDLADVEKFEVQVLTAYMPQAL